MVVAAITVLHFSATAQTVKETMLKKGKDHIPGYTIKIKHSKALASATIKETLSDAGLKKGKNKKGYHEIKGAVLPAVSNTKQDYYYKVTGNKRKATIRFAVSKGYDNYVTGANDAQMNDAIKALLADIDTKTGIKEQLNEKQGELDKIEKEKAKKQAEIDKLQKQGK